MQPVDFEYMARALRLAERGIYSTSPNPRVGAVVVKDGEVLGEGWHQRAGEDHAEIIALKQAGESARDADIYVTLEPCNHRGRTGPCSEALIAAGVAKVVYGHEDPNPEVAGTGLQKLKDAGIEVVGPCMQSDARALNPGFIKRMNTGMPFVRIKMAISLDGRTAMPDNNSFWITGPNARADVQRLRGRSCAVVTGWKTVKQDDASMTVRPEEFGIEEALLGSRQPLRVLVDSQLKLEQNIKFYRTPGQILVANTQRSEMQNHIEFSQYPEKAGHIDLEALLADLAARQCNEVLVEAGAGLAGAFFRLGVVDELIIYMAPKVMGSDSRGLFDLPLKIMDEALPVRFTDVRSVGRDIRITAVPETE